MDWTADGTVCVLLSPPKDKLSSLTTRPALQTFSKGTTARIKLPVFSLGFQMGPLQQQQIGSNYERAKKEGLWILDGATRR